MSQVASDPPLPLDALVVVELLLLLLAELLLLLLTKAPVLPPVPVVAEVVAGELFVPERLKIQAPTATLSSAQMATRRK